MVFPLSYAVWVIGLLTLCYTLWQRRWVAGQPQGTAPMVELAERIQQGARAFLLAEYRLIAFFILAVSLLLGGLAFFRGEPPFLLLTFWAGALLSSWAGWVGMQVATQANVRTAQAARSSLKAAFSVSLAGGSVMATGVASLVLLGMGGSFSLLLYYAQKSGAGDLAQVVEWLTGFALGAEGVALFARVAGGIYTKAADVGADIVGKTEVGIPEDDPRNPATIADNVGDNVGDVAGMGADLFGSLVSTILAAMVLGAELSGATPQAQHSLVMLPLFVVALGTFFSLVSLLLIRLGGDQERDVQAALNRANYLTMALLLVGCSLLFPLLLPAQMTIRGVLFTPWALWGTLAIGLGVGTLVMQLTEYFTTYGHRPVNSVVEQSVTGAATNLIAGLSLGLFSTAGPILLFVAGICLAYAQAGFFGVAMAAAGMMATTVIQLAMDAFGPIADNAGGIAEMASLPKEVRERTDVLDTVGNTTAATGKGFAIASAALTSLGLFAAFTKTAHIQGIDLAKAPVLSALFLGGMLPYLFSSLALSAVGGAAQKMVQEVRRQFKEIPGLLEGRALPDYDRCISIATYAALRQMVWPGLLTLLSPLVVGYAAGAEALAAFVAGVTVSGVLMALFQCNAGGAWDNAKKAFEKELQIAGQHYGKGSPPHQASVIGDTVGDPFKDTSGPAMNILIKLSALIALMLAPYF